jgi:hypothetical protein
MAQQPPPAILGRVGDAYENTLETRGEVLYRDKQVSRSLALAMVLTGVVFAAASVAVFLGYLKDMSLLTRGLLVALTPLFFWAGLVMPVVRTLVTTEEVRIARGLITRRIPLSAVTGVELVAPRALRDSPGPSVDLHMPEAPTELVLVAWTDAAGKPQRTGIGSRNPSGLRAAIEQARRGAPLRIEGAGEVEHQDELEAEVEAEEVEQRR